MAMRWYVVHAYSGYEKKVAAALKERIELHNMAGFASARCLCRPKKSSRCAAGRSGAVSASFFRATSWCRWSSVTTAGTW
jgi:hypothetical protein